MTTRVESSVGDGTAATRMLRVVEFRGYTLAGLGLVDGRPKYVTALGETDTPAGWRANKTRGGVLMDVDSGEVVTRGLSMPHSPRWHAGRLWVCESGAGTLGVVDPGTGR